VELRGSHDQVLPGAVAALATLPMLPANLVLCTDDVFPDELVAKGGLRDTIARVIARGLSPVSAIRLATLHAAMRLKRDDLGLVAPGRRADIVVLSDLTTVAVDRVVVDGALVAKAGALLAAPARRVDAPTDTMKLPPQNADAFRLHVKGVRNGRATLRRIIGNRFTSWGQVEVVVRDGVATPPPGHAVLTIIHRHGRAPAIPRTCLTDGWGEMRGAIATTISHDSHNLLVLGTEPADMQAAANALIEAGGGMAVARGGEVVALLPLPIAGLLAETPPWVTAENFARLRAAADEVCDWQPPYRIFRGITGISLACNAGPHLTDLGLTDGGTGDIFDPAEPLPA
jgi:adenine deaminase